MKYDITKPKTPMIPSLGKGSFTPRQVQAVVEWLGAP